MKSLGLLGGEQGQFLTDKIYQLMDGDIKGYTDLDGFLTYTNILQNGNFLDKAILSFYILDQQLKGYLCFEDFEFILS